MGKITDIHKEIIQQQQALKTTTKSTTIKIKPLFDSKEVRIKFVERLDWRIRQNPDGKEGLRLNDEIEEVIELVCQHLNNETQFELDGRSLNKGLMLGGKTGSGKTEIMQTYQDFMKQMIGKECGFVRCQDMNDAFQEIDKGNNERKRYFGIQPFISATSSVERIFDELGHEETTINDYGNKFSVMPYIFSKRYDNRSTCGRTHATTNMSKASLLDKYGSRIESRFHEMFNFIGLGVNEDSIDHRKK